MVEKKVSSMDVLLADLRDGLMADPMETMRDEPLAELMVLKKGDLRVERRVGTKDV